MADGEEDFSSLPLNERWVHKNWKVRKEAYETGAKAFDAAPNENDPLVRQFIQDSNLWNKAVADSNVAAQQEGLGALCSFLQIAGIQGCTRTRSSTISPIVEKGLAATRPAAKQKALEALLLYIELDRPDPVIDELLPILSHKQPKIIAATLGALTQIYHAYGCKTVEPKPVLKVLPKMYGHADKNVRAEAQNLTVELYRWLKEAMKPLFWNDLKPVQQQDLEKLFDKVKDEPPPKQERLLRSQQAIVEASPVTGADVDEEVEEEEAEIDLEPEYEAINVLAKVPKDLQEKLASSKWKDRKDALDDLHTAINHPRIAEGQFDDILRSLAKCMKDANIAVVTVAANCVELLAKGLKRSFGRYRSTIMSPMMERLKEKKQSVTEAISAALDAVFASTGLTECLEEILECLKHKNPQVKLESTRFLIRCLRTTREPPSPPEVKSIADVSTKLLTESQETQRAAGAEVLGTLWKILGDRAMGPHLNDLDEIRKTKIKEFYESAEVKAKLKPPKPVAPPPARAAPPKKTMGGKKPALGAKKAAPPPQPVEEYAPAPALTPRPTSRPVSKLGAPKSGLQGPGGLRPPGGLQKRLPGPSAMSSPVRRIASPDEEPAPPPPPKLGLSRGLAGRSLGKPAAQQYHDPPITPGGLSGLSSAERSELEDLRMENDRIRRENELIRIEKQKITSQYAELDDHNKELIEKHTQDHLSIKAKEAQLVRARSDVEALDQQVQSQQREIERLKRELSRQVRASSPGPLDLLAEQGHYSSRPESPATNNGALPYRNSRSFVTSPSAKSFTSGAMGGLSGMEGSNMGIGSGYGMASPRSSRLGMRSPESELPPTRPAATSSLSNAPRGGGAEGESWKRAAEVTQNLKARIEQMKAKQGLSSRPR